MTGVTLRWVGPGWCDCIGMMLPSEQAIIDGLQIHYNKYYVPFVWASTLVVKSRRQGLIKDDFAVQTILDVRTGNVENVGEKTIKSLKR